MKTRIRDRICKIYWCHTVAAKVNLCYPKFESKAVGMRA